MPRLVRLLALLVAFAALSGVLIAQDKGKDKEEKEPDAKEVNALIDKLGSDDADTRKDAEKKLLDMGEVIMPLLRKAVKDHADADVKLRCIVLGQNITKSLYGELRKFEGHTGNIRGIAVTPDGKKAVTAGMDNKLRVWDLATGKELAKLEGHTGWCWSVDIDKEGKEILSSGALDKSMRLWDMTGKELKKYEGHESRVYGAAFSPDGKHVASSGAEKETTIRIFERESGKEVKKLEGHTGWVWRIAYSPDGTRILSAGMNDNSYRIWDVESGKATVIGDKAHDGYVVGIAWMPDGKRVLTAGRDLTVKLWDAENGKLLRTYSGLGDNPEAIAVSKDGKRFLVGENKIVHVFETDTGKIIHRFEDHTDQVFAVAFTPDGRKALSAGADNVLRMWGVPR